MEAVTKDMANSLRGQGNDPPVTRFDRSHVRQLGAGRVTVIPLDQIDHVRSGKSSGHPAFIILSAIALLAGALGGVLGFGFIRIGAIVLGTLIAGGGFAAFMLVRPNMVSIESNRAAIKQAYPAAAAQHVRSFVEGLLEARGAYLEGVYEADEAEGPWEAPAEPATSEEPMPVEETDEETPEGEP